MMMIRSVLHRGLATATIPIKGVARVVQLKVSGEADAIKAQDLLLKMHNVIKKEKGFVGSTRFVCKSEWDLFWYFRFADLDSLKAYMASDTRSKKVEPLIKEIEAFATNGKTHSQNFVADDF